MIGHVRRSISKINKEISEGNIEVNPCETSGKYPCEYCQYISICDFDLNIYDYQANKNLNIDAFEAISRMKGEAD